MRITRDDKIAISVGATIGLLIVGVHIGGRKLFQLLAEGADRAEAGQA